MCSHPTPQKETPHIYVCVKGQNTMLMTHFGTKNLAGDIIMVCISSCFTCCGKTCILVARIYINKDNEDERFDWVWMLPLDFIFRVS